MKSDAPVLVAKIGKGFTKGRIFLGGGISPTLLGNMYKGPNQYECGSNVPSVIVYEEI